MVNSGGCEDKQNSQRSFDESLFVRPYEDTVWNANLQIAHGPNPDSSEIFNSSWINEGSQAPGTVEALTVQGPFWTASGILPLEKQTAAGIQTLPQQLLSQPGDMSTHWQKNIREPSDAEQKWRERKRGYDKAYRERVKQKRQKLEVENQEKDEQMKAFEAEIGRLNAENAEIQGHEQLMKSNLAELNAENESLREENLLLNQRLHTQSSELDQLLKYKEQLNMMLKKRLKMLSKEIEDMRVQTAAMEAAVEEDKNELQSFKKQSDQILINKMIIRVKVEYAFLDALLTESPNNESDSRTNQLDKEYLGI